MQLQQVVAWGQADDGIEAMFERIRRNPEKVALSSPALRMKTCLQSDML